jgi:hypothetical protein
MLRPNGLIPGQTFALVATGSIVLLGLLGVAFASGERAESAFVLLIGLALFCLPLFQTRRWIRIERAPDGWRVTTGVLVLRTGIRRLSEAEIATAMIVQDDLGYRNEWRRGRHVRVAFGSKPFNEAPPPFELAETFQLPDQELASLRDMLAGHKALK